MKRKASLLKKTLIGVAAFVAIFIIYSVIVEPRRLEVKMAHVGLPNLPVAWEGKKVLFLGDIQHGMWLSNTDTVKKAVAYAVDSAPDLILLGGDFIYHPVEDDSVAEGKEEFDKEERDETLRLINEAVDLVKPLVRAGAPVYAVLGNHDYGMEKPDVYKLEEVASILADQLKSAGIRVLNNESVKIGSAENFIYLIGLGSHYAQKDDVNKAFAGVPPDSSRIVFMHNPQSFKSVPSKMAPLAIAGHTHGGQVRLPFGSKTTWMSLVKEHEISSDGWVQKFGADGNRLYVNRGIGFSKFPIRLNCRPEVTVFILQRSKNGTL